MDATGRYLENTKIRKMTYIDTQLSCVACALSARLSDAFRLNGGRCDRLHESWATPYHCLDIFAALRQ